MAITNVSNNPINAPVALALDNLTQTVTLFNADGVTSCAAPAGSPFRLVNVGSDNILSPGESVVVTLEFTNPNNLNINFTPRLLAGSNSF